MVGDAWSAAFDLDPFINGRDTDVSGEIGKFGGLFIGVDRVFWIDPDGRALKLGVLAGGGLMNTRSTAGHSSAAARCSISPTTRPWAISSPRRW